MSECMCSTGKRSCKDGVRQWRLLEWSRDNSVGVACQRVGDGLWDIFVFFLMYDDVR